VTTPNPAPAAIHAGLATRPRAMAVIGALTIAFSAILVRAAEVAPEAAAVLRCAYAVPVLWWLAHREDRALGPRPARDRRLAAIAGVFFAIDLVAWHHAIDDVGAGLATVLANVQVVLVPLAAWMVLGERAGGRILATLPVLAAGVVLISGALEQGGYGDNPARGVAFGITTGFAYAGFILVLRSGSQDLRRPAGPLSDATAVSAVLSLAAALAIDTSGLMPSWPEHAWLLLLALSSQVAGWILISASLPRLPAALTSVLLTIQPLGSMLLGIAIFAEAPSALQVAGVAAILAGLVLVGRVRPTPDSRAIRQPLIRHRRRRHHPTPSGIEQQRGATARSYGPSS
jgi:drug/metabolite transporter (DMT)-like permease